ELDIRALVALLPERLARGAEALGLSGDISAREIVWRPAQDDPGASRRAPATAGAPLLELASAAVSLADLRCTLPLEETGGGEQAREVFLKLSDGAIELAYRAPAQTDSGACALEGTARLRGAAVRLSASFSPAAIRALWAPAPAASQDATSADGQSSRFAAVLTAELSITGLELPTHETFPAFVGSRKLGGALYAAFEDYRPRGKADIHLLLRPPAAGVTNDTAARLEGEIVPRGCACRYKYFPYDTQDVRGRLRLTDGAVLIEDMTARHGPARLVVRGRVNNTHRWTGFEVQIECLSLPLDAALYKALPASYRPLWEEAAPLGLADVVTDVTRPEGDEARGPLKVDVDVQARLLSASLSVADGRRIDHADGSLAIHGGIVTIRDLHGFWDDARVYIDGALRMSGPGPRTDLRIEAYDVPLTEAAGWAAPAGQTGAAAVGGAAAGGDARGPREQPAAGAADRLPPLQLTGLADVIGRVYRTEQGEQRRHLAVHVTSGKLFGADRAQPWNVEAGLLRVRGGRTEVQSLVCTQSGARLAASGILPERDSQTPLTFAVGVQTPAVERLPRQFVPARWTGLVEACGPSGAADLRLALSPTSQPENSEFRIQNSEFEAAPGQTAELAARVAQLRPRAFPIELRDCAGLLRFEPGRCEINGASARTGARGQLELPQGVVLWSPEGVVGRFAAAARGLDVSPELIAAAPQRLRSMLTRLAARGEFDLDLPEIELHRDGRGVPDWRLEGELALHGAALRLGVDITDLHAKLAGSCTLDPTGEAEVRGDLTIERGRLAGRAIVGWQGKLERRAGDPWVRLEDLDGELCDGRAHGWVVVNTETAEYELAARLHEIAPAQLFPPAQNSEFRAAAGRAQRPRLEGEVWLRGCGEDGGTRRGGGYLRITQGAFLQMPVLANVFTARVGRPGANAGRSADDAVDRAALRFLWQGHELQLEHIDIRGRSLRLVGTGSWNLRDGTVNLTLWGANPAHWPRIAGVTDFLESAGQELVQYHVEGPLEAPRVTTEPLPRLTDAVRRLIGEGGD
ncbi:MAG: hypothetical protein AB1716_09865, partial [Planctomycetota bacterium]